MKIFGGRGDDFREDDVYWGSNARFAPVYLLNIRAHAVRHNIYVAFMYISSKEIKGKWEKYRFIMRS